MSKKQLKYFIIVQIILYVLTCLETTKWLPNNWHQINALNYVAYTLFNLVFHHIQSFKI